MTKNQSLIDSCPIARVADLLGDHWAMLILREAFLGSVHFNEFESQLGIARNILSTRLKRLVDAGLLERTRCPDDGRVIEYRLSDAGRALHPVLIALGQWSQRWLGGECDVLRIVDRATGQRVQTVAVQAADGRRLDLEDIVMVPGPDAAADVAERYFRATRQGPVA